MTLQEMSKIVPYDDKWLRQLFYEAHVFSVFLNKVLCSVFREEDTDKARNIISECQKNIPKAKILNSLEEYLRTTMPKALTSETLREEYEIINIKLRNLYNRSL